MFYRTAIVRELRKRGLPHLPDFIDLTVVEDANDLIPSIEHDLQPLRYTDSPPAEPHVIHVDPPDSPDVIERADWEVQPGTSQQGSTPIVIDDDNTSVATPVDGPISSRTRSKCSDRSANPTVIEVDSSDEMDYNTDSADSSDTDPCGWINAHRNAKVNKI